MGRGKIYKALSRWPERVVYLTATFCLLIAAFDANKQLIEGGRSPLQTSETVDIGSDLEFSDYITLNKRQEWIFKRPFRRYI